MAKPADYTTPQLNASWTHYANVVSAAPLMNDSTDVLGAGTLTVTNISGSVTWDDATSGGRGLKRTANTAGDSIAYAGMLPTGGVGTVIVIHEVETAVSQPSRYFLNGANFQLRYANSVNQVVSRIQSTNNSTGSAGIQSGEYLKTTGYKVAILTWDADERHFYHNTLPGSGLPTDGYVGTESYYAPGANAIADCTLLSAPAGDEAISGVVILGVVTLDTMITQAQAQAIIEDPWAWLTDGTPANQAPVFAGTITNLSGTVGSAITPVDVSSLFSDPDLDALTYSQQGTWPARAGGGNWVSAAGVISGTPDTGADAGSPYTPLLVRATDAGALYDESNPFQFAVNPAGSAPAIASVSGNAVHGQPLTITGTNLGTPTVKLKYSTLSVTQATTGDATSIVIASVDSASLPYDSLTLEIVTAGGTVTRAITHVAPAGLEYVTVDVPWAATADSIFEGPPDTAAVDGDAIEYEIATDRGAAVIVRADGTLRVADAAFRHTFGVRVWDESALEWSASTEITVTPSGYIGGTPTWAGPSIIDTLLEVGAAWSIDAARFSDDDSDIVGYELGGSWPSWASVSAAGLVTGTQQLGVWPGLWITAEDVLGNRGDSNTFRLSVTPVGGPVSVEASAPGAAATASAGSAEYEDFHIVRRIRVTAEIDLAG